MVSGLSTGGTGGTGGGGGGNGIFCIIGGGGASFFLDCGKDENDNNTQTINKFALKFFIIIFLLWFKTLFIP